MTANDLFGSLQLLRSSCETDKFLKPAPFSSWMNPKTEIRKLLKARERMEKKIQELDQKIEHVLFRLNEDRRCFARDCPLDHCEDSVNDLLE